MSELDEYIQNSVWCSSMLDHICIPGQNRGYLGFSMVVPLPQRFPFGRNYLKNILVRPFKFGMWVYMGNAMNTIVL